MRFAVLLVLATSCASDGGPRLDGAMPTSAQPGAQVSLSGAHLCGASANCAMVAAKILLGVNPPMLNLQVLDYADTHATVVIPSDAPVGKTELVAQVGEAASNALPFEVLP